MGDARQHAAAAAAATPDHDAGVTHAGRATLTEGLDAAPASVPHSAPPDAEHVVGDDPAALETIYRDKHAHAHAAPFEHTHAHAERHVPKQDTYNRKGVVSDPATATSVARPGARVQGKSVFMLRHKEAIRYTYVRRGGTNVAQPFDVISKDKLSPVNYNAGHLTPHQQQQAKDKKQRLLLNPAMPRTLEINGEPHPCVLSWVDGVGAAWIAVDEIVGNGKTIVAAVKARARREAPGTLSHDPKKLEAHSTRYLVRDDRVGQKTSGDMPGGKETVLAPGQTNGDNVVHYLDKHARKAAFDGDGKRIEGKNVTRDFVALCMNLPDGKTPPVAIDTLLAGESVFVMNDASFHRSTAVYGSGKHTSNLLMTWVFGHVAMRDAHGQLVPDPNRRGWMPLRTLAVAKDHEETYIAQRSDKEA